MTPASQRGLPNSPRALQAKSFDDLKDRIAKLIVLVPIIEFFQAALRLP